MALLLVAALIGCGEDTSKRPGGGSEDTSIDDVGEDDVAALECDEGKVEIEGHCVELVDCQSAPELCHERATCKQTAAGTACVCGRGFSGDGARCEESGFTMLSAGFERTCGLRASGKMACWGQSVPGLGAVNGARAFVTRPMLEPSGESWVDVSSGFELCGVREDGSAHCWRAGAWTALPGSDWKTLQSGTLLSALRTHCGLKTDDSVWCFGDNRTGMLGVGTAENSTEPVRIVEPGPWRSVHVGSEHACAIKNEGSLWCWGKHGLDGGEHFAPHRMDPAADWVDVAGQHQSGCGVREDGTLWCWGGVRAARGALGQVDTDTDWQSVGGASTTCAIKTDNSLWCWGTNHWGERGDPSFDISRSPAPLAGQWREVEVGLTHTCALDMLDRAWCWGHGYFGQLGNGAAGIVYDPAQVRAPARWSTLSVGTNHTCAADADKNLWCWGSNTVNQAGISERQAQVPARVEDTSAISVGTSARHTCGVGADGTLWCMGVGAFGQLGLGSSTQLANRPMVVGAATNWSSVAAGQNFTCAVRGGELWCWGTNAGYQLGLGDTQARFEPARVGEDTDWATIRLAATLGGLFDHEQGYGLKVDGTLWRWGSFSDPLDPQQRVSVPTPQRYGDKTWLALDSRYDAACGIQADHSLWCWGHNFHGRFGSAAISGFVAEPARVDQSSWASLSLGETHGCAIRQDGTLWCWGLNNYGQLGLGPDTEIIVLTPNQVGSATDWTHVHATSSNTCALRADQSLWCWGYSRSGETGTGDSWYTSPQRVAEF
ncbi:MAG: hypothetical protein H0U74_05015 [Bradymonadaceae bacterium]|nr:hypothetical protein [Lujinxingiaceae bacterium]